MIKNLEMHHYDMLVALWKKTDGMGLRSLDDSYQGIESFIKRNPTTNFVYEVDNKLVAGILCGHDGRRAYIYHAVVDTAYRSKGIGKKLVRRVIEALEKEHINKVCLVVFKDNEIGNGFWQNIGFDNRKDLIYRDKVLNIDNIRLK